MEPTPFRFATPDMFYLLIAVPVLFLVFVIYRNSRSRKLKKFGNHMLLQRLAPEMSAFRAWTKFILINLAFVALVFALARPQFSSKLKDVKRKGVEIIIALDVSNSMMAEDIKPSRIERSKMSIIKLIDKLENDRVGLIVFAGEAYTQLPVTNDFAAAKMFISNINTEMIGKQGTAVGAAIELAMKSFSPQNDKQKALIIISDGENHEDDALEAASNASKNNIIIYTIGMGLAAGSPIPISLGSKDFRKDNEGNVIVTKLNEVLLKQVAAATNGIYVRATAANAGLDMIFDEINKMEKQEFDTKAYAEYNEEYAWFLYLALFFLFTDVFVGYARNIRFSNFRLFKSNFLK